jgi:hypothetical protein
MKKAFRSLCFALALTGGAGMAQAADPTAVFQQIDACVDAALAQQEGFVVGWKLIGGDPAAVQVDVLAPDDRVWTMRCSEGKVSNVERRTGNKNYKMLTTRAKVPEVSGRFTAVNSYPIAEVSQMEYGLSWKGRPYYTYQLTTNDGREATVDVNAETGQIDRTKSERKG